MSVVGYTVLLLFIMVILVFDFCPQIFLLFFFQAEDGIRDLVRSRGLGDVYKRQEQVERPADRPRRRGIPLPQRADADLRLRLRGADPLAARTLGPVSYTHLTLPTSDLV